MPAIDECEPQMIRALEKDGWRITSKPVRIPMPNNRYLYADLQAARNDDVEIIIVEVKCFPESIPQREEYYRALGQYLVYERALQAENLANRLYIVSFGMFLEIKPGTCKLMSGEGGSWDGGDQHSDKHRSERHPI